MPELDLEQLGTFVASATGAKRYRMLLVPASAGFTSAMLEKEPALEGAPIVVSKEGADGGGSASFDLAPDKADLEKKLESLADGDKVASFVIGFPGEDAGGAKAVEGPVFTVRGKTVLEVTFDIDPEDPTSRDDKITLSADDGSYKKTLTCKDDVKAGDRKTTLRWEGLDTSKKYSLEVDPGKEGKPYFLAKSFSVTE